MLQLLLFLLAGAMICAGQTSPLSYTIQTFAGSIPLGDGGTAANAMLEYPNAIAFDPKGNLYIVDEYNALIRKVSVDGMICTIAGTGNFSLSGIGESGGQLLLSPIVNGLATDPAGDVYIADSANYRLLKVTPDGTVMVLLTSSQVPGASSQSPFYPNSLALDTAGNLYIADGDNHQVVRVSPDGTVTRVAGSGAAGDSGDGGPPSAARLSATGVFVDTSGTMYISDTSAHKIRRVTPDGIISTIAGTGKAGFNGDGGPAGAAQLYSPWRVIGDNAGNLYIADTGNSRVRMITPDGNISTIAGTANPNAMTTGDEGPATQAMIESPYDIALSPAGDLYIASRHCAVRVVTSDGMIHTAVGRPHFGGDGGLAGNAIFDTPHTVAVDGAGNVYIADTGNYRIRKVDPQGIITTIAGTGNPGSEGDDGPATSATLGRCYGLVVDSSGNVFAGCTDGRVRRISPSGTISAVAGGGTSAQNGVPATSASLATPAGLGLDGSGNLYIADMGQNRIRKVTPDGIITNFAGTGSAGNGGDGGPANSAQLNSPASAVPDSAGNIYIADSGNHRVRVIRPDGTIAPFAGSGASGNSGDEGPAVSARITSPADVAPDAAGNVYITDNATDAGRVRMVTTDGIIHTIAGTSMRGFAGDGGPALNAQFYTPLGLAVDGLGNVYLADVYNERIRVLIAASQGPGGCIVGAERHGSPELIDRERPR